MPKKKPIKIIVEPDLPLDEKRLYQVQVREIALDHRTRQIRVLLHHLDQEYMCSRAIGLPLPVRPGNLTGRFFQACQKILTIGGEIALEDMVGRIINARFTKAGNRDDYEARDFQPLSEPQAQADHDSTRQTTPT